MNKKIIKNKRLVLSTATIRKLSNYELLQIQGGLIDQSKADKNPCKPL